MSRAAVLLACLALAVGCGNRVLNPEVLAGLDWRWEGNRLHVTNPDDLPQRKVEVIAAFDQGEVLAHTLGYAQYHTPAGRYQALRILEVPPPGKEAVLRFSYNLGPDSMPQGGIFATEPLDPAPLDLPPGYRERLEQAMPSPCLKGDMADP